jgi:hypothetical protein
MHMKFKQVFNFAIRLYPDTTVNLEPTVPKYKRILESRTSSVSPMIPGGVEAVKYLAVTL